VEFKRPLNLGEVILVRTWIDDMRKSDVTVHFEIVRKSSGKLACDGQFGYTLINRETGRAAVIPYWIARKYAI
jgi:thioesterase-3